MKIKYITEDGLAFLKNNKNELYKKVIKENISLEQFLQNTNYLKESNIEIEDFILETGENEEGKESLTDAENVKRVYNHMKALSDSQASDERLWVAMTLGSQLDYMKYRWNPIDSTDMLNRFFFNYSSQRSLFRNGIARLWWIGRVTVDYKRDNPYELTDFVCKYQDFIESVCGRNVFNNPITLKGTVSAIYDASKEGRSIDRDLIRAVAKYVNLLAGTYIIDVLGYDFIYNKVSAYIKNHS
ncbi:hypothetical protein SAMN02910413_1144 [Pseudobutyrivibrio sp. C4]|uniref:DUF6339 family protein n=1 Tax=Pseudobutyrivibrio sp. C4 TaxID=1520803 RepID=UPI0008B19940|nr:DUF6339 family protein [Pseudobutyrivibrio sp. C4]SES89307.1 hypothetical protein SAMN02910413_1144 [Pseudobutyrivibrio sp. C4]